MLLLEIFNNFGLLEENVVIQILNNYKKEFRSLKRNESDTAPKYSQLTCDKMQLDMKIIFGSFQQIHIQGNCCKFKGDTEENNSMDQK